MALVDIGVREGVTGDSAPHQFGPLKVFGQLLQFRQTLFAVLRYCQINQSIIISHL